jgi:hypothetical protein
LIVERHRQHSTIITSNRKARRSCPHLDNNDIPGSKGVGKRDRSNREALMISQSRQDDQHKARDRRGVPTYWQTGGPIVAGDIIGPSAQVHRRAPPDSQIQSWKACADQSASSSLFTPA